MGVLDLGPFPRRPLRYALTPEQVFIEGIPDLPEAEGTPWLQADADVTGGIALGDSFPFPDPIEGLCDASADAGPVESITGDFPTYANAVELQCPVRVSKGRRQSWWDQVRTEVLNATLDAAVFDQLTAAAAPSWDDALDAAISYLDYQYGSAGMIGLPPRGFQELSDYLRYESDGVYTNTGHRVWLRRGRTVGGDSHIAVTSDVYYASRADELAANEISANVDIRKITVYVKALFDLPGLLFATSEP